ncbi:glutathione S-transferase [Shimia sp.]|uniref:glutathione S-transferase n=1 Tax=Shimia sp. TaxID=1954381 RepID=UPI0035652829
MSRPILYSFRRCPYAMRARLGLASAGLSVELREIVLRDKAPEFLATSPSATVPCLKAGGMVIDESLDIMLWALAQSDPEQLRDMPRLGHDLIAATDGAFKTALDRYKYHSRYGSDRDLERTKAAGHLIALDAQLDGKPWLFGDTPRLADLAILPFIRQFALTDKAWFDAQPWPHLHRWLGAFLTSERFLSIMLKYPRWQAGDTATRFP